MARKLCPDCGHQFTTMKKHRLGESLTCGTNQGRAATTANSAAARDAGWAPVGRWGTAILHSEVPMRFVGDKSYASAIIADVAGPLTQSRAFNRRLLCRRKTVDFEIIIEESRWAPWWAVPVAQLKKQSIDKRVTLLNLLWANPGLRQQLWAEAHLSRDADMVAAIVAEAAQTLFDGDW